MEEEKDYRLKEEDLEPQSESAKLRKYYTITGALKRIGILEKEVKELREAIQIFEKYIWIP